MLDTQALSGRIALSKLGLGCGVFSGAYGSASDEEVVGAVRKALSSGINLVDTSPYYNNSEVRLGNALHRLKDEFPRSSYHICTKLGRYGYKKADFDYSAKRVVASVDESMRRLNTDYLDVVLCHDVEFVDLEKVVDEALPKLLELKAQGIVRSVGISGYPLETLLRIAQIQNERSCPLDVVLSYCNYNLHCQRLANYVPQLRAAGVKTIIAASPLSMGLLNADSTPDWHPGKPELKDAVAQCIDLVCSQLGSGGVSNVTLADMAERFAFAYSDVDVHLVGAKTASEVSDALAAYSEAQKTKRAGNAVHVGYDDPNVQSVYEQIQKTLKPFADYTWPSPPADA
ncbi:hypothetical protein GGI12_001859 [Dipsacomyces acuminosporus]|nr:hypothetical protein GGI12_001859 [Dipsacomyces acuminosporus]